ncbi:MAG: WG repeat-containing protein, partial [Mycobacterium leprae]
MKAARHCVTLSLLLAALLALPACTPPVKNAATGAPAAAPVAEQPPAAKAAQPAAAPFVEPAPVQVALYPAYVRDGNGTRWGYINASGQFEILPQWDAAEPFGSDGLAVVTLGKLKGLINAAGKIVTAPAYSSIDEPKSGLRIADTIGSGSTVLGPTGAVLSHGASAFSEGLGITFRNGLYGYVRPDGAVVVEPQYRQAGPFQNGLAVVWLQDGRHAIIDTAGKQLAASPDWWDDQLSEGLIPYQSQTTHLWGYVSTAGEVAITAQFGSADSFQDGYAVVKPAGNGPKRQGLINRQGSYVIPPTYGTIRPVGSGLYAASRANEPSVADWNTPKALLARDGRQLTDFVYYEITRVAPNILMVGDLHADSFVDDTGAKISSLPTLPAGGFVRWYGNLLATMVEGALRYEAHDGKIVWQGKAADRSVTLEGGGKVLRQVYGPDRFTDVSYPSIAGLPNPKVESLINDALKKAFLDGTATKMEQLTVGY